MSVLATVLQVWAGTASGFTVLLWLGLLLWRRRRRAADRLAGAAPPILILRPCEGDDPGLFENLRSTLTADYAGSRRILFLVPDESDPSYAPACAAAAGQPSATVVLTRPPTICNRKVAQLEAGLAYAAAQAEPPAPVLVCIDSDVRLIGHELEVLVAALTQPTVAGRRPGAAFAPPVEVEPATWGDWVAGAIVGASPQSFMALYGLNALFGGVPSMAGPLCAYRRQALDEIGGLASVRDCLGEDYELSRRLWAAGYAVEMSGLAVRCHDGGKSAGQMLARVARWITVVRSQRPLLLPGYPLFLALTPLCATALVLSGLLEAPAGSPLSLGFAGLLLGTRTLLAATLRFLQAPGRRPGLLGAAGKVVTALVEDLVAEAVLLLGLAVALGRSQISWRGHRFRVLRGGRLQPLPGVQPSPASPIP